MNEFLWGVFQSGPPEGAGPSIQRFFPILLLVVGIFLVALVAYRLLFPNLRKITPQEDRQFDTASKGPKGHPGEPPEESAQAPTPNTMGADRPLSKETMLRFLETDERKVVETLLEAKGSMLQKEISWKTGFSRVKTHRILARLIRRGVVSAEKYYNTNKITLTYMGEPKTQDQPKNT